MNFLRHFRRKLKMTQKEFGQQLGVHSVTVCRWETGKTEPTASELRMICDVLNCTEDELINGPFKRDWKFEMTHNLEGVIKVRRDKPIAYLSIQPDGMIVTLAGGIDLWQDDETFEDFIKQLREKRDIGLRYYADGWA